MDTSEIQNKHCHLSQLVYLQFSYVAKLDVSGTNNGRIIKQKVYFFLALFYSPLAGFSLLACEVS